MGQARRKAGWAACLLHFYSRRADWFRLSVKLHLGITKEDEVRWRDRDRTVDAEYRDLELVARIDGFGEHDAVRHVEALDSGGAAVATAPPPPRACAHLPTNPPHNPGPPPLRRP